MTPRQLLSITNENVVVLEFIKKNKEIRVMTCTTCLPLLTSQEGLLYLHYNKPKSYNIKESKNHLVVWDITKRDYRQVQTDTVKIRKIIRCSDFLKLLKK